MIKLFKGRKSSKISAKFTIPSNIKYYIEMDEYDWFRIAGSGKYSVDIFDPEYDRLKSYFKNDKKSTSILEMWESFCYQEIAEEVDAEEEEILKRDRRICPDCLNQLNDAGECPICLHNQNNTYY